jgi:hypothetical protein
MFDPAQVVTRLEVVPPRSCTSGFWRRQPSASSPSVSPGVSVPLVVSGSEMIQTLGTKNARTPGALPTRVLDEGRPKVNDRKWRHMIVDACTHVCTTRPVWTDGPAPERSDHVCLTGFTTELAS